MDRLSHDEMETVDEWFARLTTLIASRGGYSRAYQWHRWVSPVIGRRTWPEVTAADIERIRDDLDAAIERHRVEGAGRGRLCAITAYDVWFMLRGAVRKARTTKVRSLRALAGRPDPSIDIEPPGERRDRIPRRRPFVFPRELAALLGCASVDRAWRRLYAIAAYSYLRPGELAVLRWSDVDFDARVFRITKSLHYVTRASKPPKTANGLRDVPIEPTLLPLLGRMRRDSSEGDLVAPLLVSVARSRLSTTLRSHLSRAGIVRPLLHESGPMSARATFRTLRDSGMTWLALAGVDAMRIMRRAGHDDLSTTMRYVKQAEDISGTLGRPFGALPRCLIRGRG